MEGSVEGCVGYPSILISLEVSSQKYKDESGEAVLFYEGAGEKMLWHSKDCRPRRQKFWMAEPVLPNPRFTMLLYYIRSDYIKVTNELL